MKTQLSLVTSSEGRKLFEKLKPNSTRPVMVTLKPSMCNAFHICARHCYRQKNAWNDAKCETTFTGGVSIVGSTIVYKTAPRGNHAMARLKPGWDLEAFKRAFTRVYNTLRDADRLSQQRDRVMEVVEAWGQGDQRKLDELAEWCSGQGISAMYDEMSMQDCGKVLGYIE